MEEIVISMVVPKKGQVSVEFVMVVSFVLFIFVGLMFVFSSKMRDINKTNDELNVAALKDQIINEISFGRQTLDGYSRTFAISALIQNEGYSMEVEDDSILTITYKELEYVYPLPCGVLGNLSLTYTPGETKHNIAVSKQSGILSMVALS